MNQSKLEEKSTLQKLNFTWKEESVKYNIASWIEMNNHIIKSSTLRRISVGNRLGKEQIG
jgi:hypothetical protein